MLADHIGIPQLREMAGRSEQVSGEIGLRDLSRLASFLHTEQGAENRRLDVQLSFHRGAQGFPEISGLASGSLELRCQRCLGALEWPVDLSFRLAIVESDSDVDDIPESFDTVVAGEHGIEFAKIIEDEVLASLPLAPMHQESDGCRMPELPEHQDETVSTATEASSERGAEADTNRPFAQLADLLSTKVGVNDKK